MSKKRPKPIDVREVKAPSGVPPQPVDAQQPKAKGKTPAKAVKARSFVSPVVMITTPDRVEQRALTLASLEAGGVSNVHIQEQQGELGQAAQRRNVHAALLWALQNHGEAPGVLLVEDDIEVAETLGEWVEFVERQEHPVTFYAIQAERLWPERLQRVATGQATPDEGELVKLRNVGIWWGSQCLWLPMPLVERLARHEVMPIHERGYGPFDTTLATLLREWGACMLGAAPGLVQHTALPNLNQPSKPRHAAASFSRTAKVPQERT